MILFEDESLKYKQLFTKCCDCRLIGLDPLLFSINNQILYMGLELNQIYRFIVCYIWHSSFSAVHVARQKRSLGKYLDFGLFSSPRSLSRSQSFIDACGSGCGAVADLLGHLPTQADLLTTQLLTTGQLWQTVRGVSTWRTYTRITHSLSLQSLT